MSITSHPRPGSIPFFGTDRGQIDPTLGESPKGRRDTNNPVYNVDCDRLRGRSIYAMCWRLEPDEAMVIEWDCNELFLMMTDVGVFMTSMDYLYRPVTYSPARTKVDSARVSEEERAELMRLGFNSILRRYLL
jgi:hypothetical protein